MDIGKRLRKLREDKALTQEYVEKRTGLMRSYISRIECGYTKPGIDTLEKWSKALGVSMVEFFAGIPSPRQPANRPHFTPYEKRLLDALIRIREQDRRLFLSLATTLVRHEGRNGRKG